MAAPILTAAEQAELAKQKTQQEQFAADMANNILVQDQNILDTANLETAYIKYFNWYTDDVLAHYYSERRALNALFQAAPIELADATNPGNKIPSRTTPAMPDTDIIRIAEFDGGGTSYDPANEQRHIDDQEAIADALVNGAGTDTTIDRLSADLTADINVVGVVQTFPTPITITVGQTYLLRDNFDELAIITIDTVTDTTPIGVDPDPEADIAFTWVVRPINAIPSGTLFNTDVNGYTDGERDTKTAPGSQNSLDMLINELERRINGRITAMAAQTTAIGLNDNTDSNFATALANIVTSTSALNAYLVGTDVGDVGLAVLAAETSTRQGQVTTRISQLSSTMAGLQEATYQVANALGNSINGTIVAAGAATDSKAVAIKYKETAEAVVGVIDDIT